MADADQANLIARDLLGRWGSSSDLGFFLGGMADAAKAPLDFAREAWADKNARAFILTVAGGIAGGAAAGAAGEAGGASATAGFGEAAYAGGGAAAGAEAGAAAGGAAASGATASEPVAVDFSYLDAVELGDAWVGGEEFVAAAEPAAEAAIDWDAFASEWEGGVADSANENAAVAAASAESPFTGMLKRVGEKLIGRALAPEAAARDLSSRVASRPGVPVVRSNGGGALLSPAAQKNLLLLGGLGLLGIVIYKAASK